MLHGTYSVKLKTDLSLPWPVWTLWSLLPQTVTFCLPYTYSHLTHYSLTNIKQSWEQTVQMKDNDHVQFCNKLREQCADCHDTIKRKEIFLNQYPLTMLFHFKKQQ